MRKLCFHMLSILLIQQISGKYSRKETIRKLATLQYSYLCIVGIPQLHSNIPSFSGILCPTTSVRFICNAYEFGTSGLIDWYLDDTLLTSFIYRNEPLPVTRAINAPTFVGTLQLGLIKVGPKNLYDFENITVTISVENLAESQGRTISCGSYARRSNRILIGYYTVFGKELLSIYVCKNKIIS